MQSCDYRRYASESKDSASCSEDVSPVRICGSTQKSNIVNGSKAGVWHEIDKGCKLLNLSDATL